MCEDGIVLYTVLLIRWAHTGERNGSMAVKEKTEHRTTEGKENRIASTPKKNAAEWKKPVLEDVSGKIMAQPYIRFT